MSDLDEYIDAALDRDESVVEFDSDKEYSSAVFSWSKDDETIVARLSVGPDGMRAEISAYRDGKRQHMDVMDILDTVVAFAKR